MNSRIAVRSGRLSSVPPLRNWSCEALGLPRVRYMPCLLAGGVTHCSYMVAWSTAHES